MRKQCIGGLLCATIVPGALHILFQVVSTVTLRSLCLGYVALSHCAALGTQSLVGPQMESVGPSPPPGKAVSASPNPSLSWKTQAKAALQRSGSARPSLQREVRFVSPRDRSSLCLSSPVPWTPAFLSAHAPLSPQLWLCTSFTQNVLFSWSGGQSAYGALLRRLIREILISHLLPGT